MKRDMDLIRLLLLDVEGEEEVDLSGYIDEQVKYHKYLLIDAGLAVGDSTIPLHEWKIQFCYILLSERKVACGIQVSFC